MRTRSRVARWAVFDPPLRDPSAGLSATRDVWCTACHRRLGTTKDPVEALLVAWHHRRHRGADGEG